MTFSLFWIRLEQSASERSRVRAARHRAARSQPRRHRPQLPTGLRSGSCLRRGSRPPAIVGSTAKGPSASGPWTSKTLRTCMTAKRLSHGRFNSRVAGPPLAPPFMTIRRHMHNHRKVTLSEVASTRIASCLPSIRAWRVRLEHPLTLLFRGSQSLPCFLGAHAHFVVVRRPHSMCSDTLPAPGLRPCVTIRRRRVSGETPSTPAAFSSAPMTVLGKLSFTSVDGPNLAHSLSSVGVRSCPDSSSELVDSSAEGR
jgi:hypothetical protein